MIESDSGPDSGVPPCQAAVRRESSEAPAAVETIDIAAVMRAHGLRGDLLVKVFNPESNLLFELDRVQLHPAKGDYSERQIQHAQVHGDNVILRLSGVQGRDAAEGLKGSLLKVPRASLPELGDDEFYFVDLEGLEVRDMQGTRLGRVDRVIDYPTVNCLEFRHAERIWELPMLERYLERVDLEGGFVVVVHLDELEDMSRPDE